MRSKLTPKNKDWRYNQSENVIHISIHTAETEITGTGRHRDGWIPIQQRTATHY